MGDTGAMIHMQSLIDDAKCFETIRDLRWPNGVHCPTGDSFEVTKQGRDDTQPERQRYLCKSCEQRFDDVTNTLLISGTAPSDGLALFSDGLFLPFLHCAATSRTCPQARARSGTYALWSMRD
jgi:hypothetical protein